MTFYRNSLIQMYKQNLLIVDRLRKLLKATFFNRKVNSRRVERENKYKSHSYHIFIKTRIQQETKK